MHTSIRVRIHCVFGTKSRAELIPVSLQPKLWAYMRGIAENIGLEVMAIGGMPDHVHVLFSLPGTITIATAVQKLKANFSRWMREQHPAFSWQEGFGAFSVSASQIPTTVAYIENQAEHHRKHDFAGEWQKFLRRHGIAVPSLRDSPE